MKKSFTLQGQFITLNNCHVYMYTKSILYSIQSCFFYQPIKLYKMINTVKTIKTKYT